MKLYNRIKETSTTTGPGEITLLGAVQGFSRFNQFYQNGDKLFYCILTATQYEIGKGTYSSNTLSRDEVLSSSNNNQKIDFSSEVKQVYVTYPGEKAVFIENDSSNREFITLGDQLIKSNSGVLEVKNSGDSAFSTIRSTSGIFSRISHVPPGQNTNTGGVSFIGSEVSISGNSFPLGSTAPYTIRPSFAPVTAFTPVGISRQLVFFNSFINCPSGVISSKFVFDNASDFMVGSGVSNVSITSDSTTPSGVKIIKNNEYGTIGVKRVLFGPDSSGTQQIESVGNTIRFAKRGAGNTTTYDANVYIDKLYIDPDKLPTSDPVEFGRVWVSGDILRISRG